MDPAGGGAGGGRRLPRKRASGGRRGDGRPRGRPADLRAQVRLLPPHERRREHGDPQPPQVRQLDRRGLALRRLGRGDRAADPPGSRPDAEIRGEADRRGDPPDGRLRAGALEIERQMNRVIRLFPLPEVVLLPGTLLPLHIFEPRYRAMVADSLEGDRLIGMAMLKPGWEEGGDAPGIHEIGGAGEIVESEKLPAGRYNILLEGRFRYRVLHEQDGSAPYRIADVEEIASIPFPAGEDEERARRAADRLFESLSGPLELPPMPREALPADPLPPQTALRF